MSNYDKEVLTASELLSRLETIEARIAIMQEKINGIN